MQTPDHILVIGTRPEAIKCAPIIAAFERRGMRHRLLVVFSGQQPALLGSALPHLRFDIRMPEWPHAISFKEQRAWVSARFCELFTELRCGPGTRVIVQGDTATSFMAALAAEHAGAEVHHVEAGLRSGCRHDPFPEEFHRRAISRLARQHYAPTSTSKANLLAEGVMEEQVLITGNTGIDNLGSIRVPVRADALRDMVFISLHRRESHGEVVHRIMSVVLELAANHPGLRFVWVRHSHPAIARALDRYGRAPVANVEVHDPMAHDEVIARSQHYALVMTDSGGMQEEAAHLGIPLIVLRRRTERPEALTPSGGVLCAPNDRERIVRVFGELIDQERRPRPVFGDGNAAERIVEHMLSLNGTT